MIRNKILSIILIVTLLASIPVIRSHAAPSTSVGAGTIMSITFDTNPATKITNVLVTLLDTSGLAQKVRISLDTAVQKGFVIPNINIVMIGKIVEIPNTDPLHPTFVLSGIVNNLVLVTDPVTKITTLTVTLTDTMSIVHDVNLNLSDALLLGLTAMTINTTMIGTPTVIDPLLILESTTYSQVVTKLGSYFEASLGVTLDQLAAYQKAGFGYGVITQACWMATQMNGNATLLDQILTAKRTGDFSTIILPDGKMVANWGQLRKLTLTAPHQNLGSIMSGKATPLPTLIPTSTPGVSQGNGNGNGNGNGKGNGNSNGHGGKK